MKNNLYIGFLCAVLMGCSSVPTTYTAIRIGPDKYLHTGEDSNQLEANAFQTCKDDQFDDYTIIESKRYRLLVRCDKAPKPLLTKTSEAVDEFLKKIDNWSKSFEEWRKKSKNRRQINIL